MLIFCGHAKAIIQSDFRQIPIHFFVPHFVFSCTEEGYSADSDPISINFKSAKLLFSRFSSETTTGRYVRIRKLMPLNDQLNGSYFQNVIFTINMPRASVWRRERNSTVYLTKFSETTCTTRA